MHMSNARVLQRRAGIKRRGPSQRASVQALDLFEGVVVVRKRVPQRQLQCWAKRQCLEEASMFLTIAEDGELERDVAPIDVSRLANKICHFVILQFQDCKRGPQYWEVVLGTVVKNTAIIRHFP